MKTSKISILQYLRSNVKASNGKIPIYMRVTINGNRIEMSTSKFIIPSQWNSKMSRMKGNSNEANSINSHLDSLKFKVYQTENDLLRSKIEVTAANFKNSFFGIEEKARMLIPIFMDHNARMKALIGKKFTISTYTKYETTLKHVKEFLKLHYNQNDFQVANITVAFVNDFDFYLRNTKDCNNNTTVKYVRNLGKIIKICFVNDWLKKDPYLLYEGSMEEVEITPLTESELQVMYNKIITISRLELVRDIYIFSCFTGLAYIDVEQLTSDKISFGIDGNKWIFTHRQKTDNPSNIPLLPIAEEILAKYENHPKAINSNRLLPILSNQKMNSYLKEVADICGIKKELTFHTARHTFATTVTLSNGVPIESVSKMLGHKSLRTTQHYAKILDKKVSKDMMTLKDRLSGNPELKRSGIL